MVDGIAIEPDELKFLDNLAKAGSVYALQFAQNAWFVRHELDRDWTDGMGAYRDALLDQMNTRIAALSPLDPTASGRRVGLSEWIRLRGD